MKFKYSVDVQMFIFFFLMLKQYFISAAMFVSLGNSLGNMLFCLLSFFFTYSTHSCPSTNSKSNAYIKAQFKYICSGRRSVLLKQIWLFMTILIIVIGCVISRFELVSFSFAYIGNEFYAVRRFILKLAEYCVKILLFV